MGKKTKTDPAGQQSSANRGTKTLVRRLDNAERKIKALFRDVDKVRRTKAVIQNAETTVYYDYQVTAQELTLIQNDVEFILNAELLESQDNFVPPLWYWKKNVEPSYREGTLEELNNLNQLIAGAAIAGVVVKGFAPRQVSIEQALLSQPYRETLDRVYVQNFESIKSLSKRTAGQVVQQINAGIEAGIIPSEISKSISERFDVAKSSAKRISETEINKAYNNAKLAANDVISQQTGLRAGVIHISALSTTTRATHAARHGNAYTTVDQLQWWDSGSNRIFCKCSTISVLVDSSGNVVQTQTQEKIKAEKSFFN